MGEVNSLRHVAVATLQITENDNWFFVTSKKNGAIYNPQIGYYRPDSFLTLHQWNDSSIVFT
ncbi:MAG: hypothetical protein HYZ34_02360 [Ignavibacteriae bacterium]|nr:hypothetical protein [Ignavibacteriota bacterium]